MKPSLQLTIRAASSADAPHLASAQRKIATSPGLLVSRPGEIDDARLAQKIEALNGADNGRFLVAEAAGGLVGHGMLDPLPFAAVRHVVHLTMVTHPGWQGRGVGGAILGALIDWARASPAVGKIELHVRATNQAARALYARAGFREVGRLRQRVEVADGRYVDDVVMELLVD